MVRYFQLQENDRIIWLKVKVKSMSVKRHQFDNVDDFIEAREEEVNQLVMYMHGLIERECKKARKLWRVAMFSTVCWGITFLFLVNTL